MNRLIPIATAFAATAFALSACKQTNVSFLDRVYRVEEFDQQSELRNRVIAECESNPGQLKDEPNCINAAASARKAEEIAHSRPEAARRGAARQDIATIKQGLLLFKMDVGRWPKQNEGLRALVDKDVWISRIKGYKDGGYLERLPSDPWGHPYQYRNPGTYGEVDVFSFGQRLETSESAPSVIGSWQD